MKRLLLSCACSLLLAPAVPTDAAVTPKAAPGPRQKAKKQFAEPKWLMPRVEGPHLHYRTFDSKTAGEKVSYLIYLPPDYETAPTRRYPTVFWLHGIGGSQQGVPAMAARLTDAIAAGKTPPMIVVYVNGMINSGYTDGRFPVETVTIRELIPHIDATYRTLATRDGRAIEGFSMGGGGTARWGFKYPELFGTVSILAGAMWASDAARAMTNVHPTESHPDDSPWVFVETNLAQIRGHTAVRVVVGGKDSLKGINTTFHEKLAALGVDHEFHIVPDAPHSPNPLYEGLGDDNWAFYRAAFARENIAAAEPQK